MTEENRMPIIKQLQEMGLTYEGKTASIVDLPGTTDRYEFIRPAGEPGCPKLEIIIGITCRFGSAAEECRIAADSVPPDEKYSFITERVVKLEDIVPIVGEYLANVESKV